MVSVRNIQPEQEIMSEKETFLRNPDVVLRDEDGSGSLLFNPDTGEVHVINDTGRFILTLCAETVTMDGIIHEFGEAYDDLTDNLREDVESFLSIMIEGGFIGSG